MGLHMKAAFVSAAMLALCAASLGAQAANKDPDKIVADGGVKVPGWQGRLDPRPASQGRKITEASFAPAGAGIHVIAGPAATYWNPVNTASGNYNVSATFIQQKASAHPEGYGLLLAGKDLDSASQSYFYFLVRQDGKFLVNHRADDATVHKIVDWTANPAVKAIDAAGKATNKLAIDVGATDLKFLVNGEVVHTIPRSTVDSGGGHAGTTGIAGIRVNHNLEVHIDGFAVTRAR